MYSIIIFLTLFKTSIFTSYNMKYVGKREKLENKNDNIHKNEVQQIRWSDEY